MKQTSTHFSSTLNLKSWRLKFTQAGVTQYAECYINLQDIRGKQKALLSAEENVTGTNNTIDARNEHFCLLFVCLSYPRFFSPQARLGELMRTHIMG